MHEFVRVTMIESLIDLKKELIISYYLLINVVKMRCRREFKMQLSFAVAASARRKQMIKRTTSI